MVTIILKSVIHNIGVVLVALALAYMCTLLDGLLGLHAFSFKFSSFLGAFLLLLGFALRLWATAHFYTQKMRVIWLEPQESLITSGPYHYSRNPLYLGGNVFCFFGAALLFGSPTAVVLTIVHLPFLDLFIQREEKQLEQKFGEEFVAYKKQVRRWL
jgi:protein-S-isoprenylcysteine O-methyltransferase Ste14